MPWRSDWPKAGTDVFIAPHRYRRQHSRITNLQWEIATMKIDGQDLPFTSPERDRYFEDYTEGEVYTIGEVVVDGEEMVDFAQRYDPQDMHVDERKAKAGPFKGLIASGWFTGSLIMRLYATRYLSNASSMASPGFDSLNWLVPVRGGDVLTVHATVKEATRSKTRPDRGVVKTFLKVQNQNDIVVMSIDAVNMIACRPG